MLESSILRSHRVLCGFTIFYRHKFKLSLEASFGFGRFLGSVQLLADIVDVSRTKMEHNKL